MTDSMAEELKKENSARVLSEFMENLLLFCAAVRLGGYERCKMELNGNLQKFHDGALSCMSSGMLLFSCKIRYLLGLLHELVALRTKSAKMLQLARYICSDCFPGMSLNES